MNVRQKAKLQYQTSRGDLDFKGTVAVEFLNPEELSQGTTAKFSAAPRNPEANKHFERVTTDDFTVTLFIDTSEEENPDAKNALKEIENLKKILLTPIVVVGENKVLPLCRFVWGKFLFQGYCTKLSERYTLFSAHGHPLRAEASLTLASAISPKQARKKGNDTNSRKFWTVRSGDRLDLIANAMFNDPALWRPIAAANDIESPLDFPEAARIGTTLIIPDVLGRLEEEA